MDAVLAGLVVPNVQNHSLAALVRAATAAGFSNSQVPFDEFGVPGSIEQTDGGTLPPDVLDCVQGLLAGYCFPAYAGTTQTLLSHHFWIA